MRVLAVSFILICIGLAIIVMRNDFTVVLIPVVKGKFMFVFKVTGLYINAKHTHVFDYVHANNII